ncbi:YtxH domain-containing protein [Herbiconiux sp. L3-i23]|uniref:YtxH domain-containing protein n=1 Tax=Herbiconiux sp. L3-i23 TaxID=2905871 RepID=UPI00204AFBE6|nr:YtxH domain-containing protein [Herbiconiux sp. L3-i23]BDI21287.1 hypothetical protein L3i23_00630 [Herbiconiux sp. L3-i23]
MKGKLVFATGLAVGYVLGTRAGRRRYEQIKASAQKLWTSAPVQKGVEQVQGFVDEHSPDVPAVLADGAKKVIDKVAESASGKSAARKASSQTRSTTTRRSSGASANDAATE